jgi:hypothetical protein
MPREPYSGAGTKSDTWGRIGCNMMPVRIIRSFIATFEINPVIRIHFVRSQKSWHSNEP